MSNQIQFNESEDAIVSKHDAKVKARALVEVAICRRLLRDLSAAGYELIVSDGETEEPVTIDGDKAVRHLFGVDESSINTMKDGKESFVFLVFGNDGYDLICDYGTSLEPVLEPIFDWIDSAANAGKCPVLAD